MPPMAGYNPTIRFTVVAVLIFATALTAGLAIGLQYYFGQSLAKDAAQDLYTLASMSVADQIQSISSSNYSTMELLAENPALYVGESEQAQLRIFATVLANSPLHYGVYVGNGEGSFFELVNLKSGGREDESLQASPEDHWLGIRVSSEGAPRMRYYDYYNEDFELRAQRAEPTDFNSASRIWYTQAMASDDIQRSVPYTFALAGQTGHTLSKRIGSSDTVVGIDTTLSTISDFLAAHFIAQYGELYLYTESGDVLASSVDQDKEAGKVNPGAALIAMVSDPSQLDQLVQARVDDEIYFVYGTHLATPNSRSQFYILSG